MEGAVDDAHATPPEVGVDDVAADLRAARDLAFHVATGLYGTRLSPTQWGSTGAGGEGAAPQSMTVGPHPALPSKWGGDSECSAWGRTRPNGKGVGRALAMPSTAERGDVPPQSKVPWTPWP